MTIRVRFAPSPTGKVHIGNIRVAIFNWLFARHNGGKFLLRVEDTDRERSTDEAIEALHQVMKWLGLDYDEEVFYQSRQCERHLLAADRLLEAGHAYRFAKGDGGEAVLFRIPWNLAEVAGISTVGEVSLKLHADVPLIINKSGVEFAQISRKGKAVPSASCLSGMYGMRVFDADGGLLFSLNEQIDDILAGKEEFCFDNAVTISFTRRQISYTDLVKGKLSKPLDSLKDFVIVRSNGSPVFHLANVCDDIEQRISHIIRGDDHVENSYKHLFMFWALGAEIPAYAHLPMIVNVAGKPYSKRDGDAFVGDFKSKGILPETLFNYLTFLGWSTGDDREKLSKAEMVELFTLERVHSSAAQMDMRKLQNLNGMYMAELPAEVFVREARRAVEHCSWSQGIDEKKFAQVAELMQSRTKLYTMAEQWEYFFVDIPTYDPKAVRKFLAKPKYKEAFQILRDYFIDNNMINSEHFADIIVKVAQVAEVPSHKFNQPIRVAITGCTSGPDMLAIIPVVGKELIIKRLTHVISNLCEINQ